MIDDSSNLPFGWSKINENLQNIENGEVMGWNTM